MSATAAPASDVNTGMAGNVPWEDLLLLPCEVSVEVPIPGFTVGDCLRLEPGSTIQTKWNQGVSLPIRANGRLLGWTEFEVVGEKLAVRLTELM